MHHSAEPGVCLQHPDYGLVSPANADDLMLKLDEFSGSQKDLDRELGRLAQVGFRMFQNDYCKKIKASLQW